MSLLYTIQKPDHDITRHSEPLFYYKQSPYSYIADYLGWNQWVWCFQTLQDFDNDWLFTENLLDLTLWILDIPAKKIVWCSLEKHCNGCDATEEIYPNPTLIRLEDDVPMGLVEKPINPKWVLKTINPARLVLEEIV